MFTHICISAQDLAKSKAFYDAALAPLGVASIGQVNDRTCVYATETGKLLVMTPADGGPATFANGGTIGFKCTSPEQVQAFHDTAVANGGTSIEEPPGLRQGSLGAMYLAYVRDPDGNKLCALYRVKSSA